MNKIKEKLKNIEYNNFYPLFFTVIFILIVIQYSFSTLDAIFYDLWVRSDVVAQWDDNIIEIVLDEESDESNPASPVAPAGELEPGPGSAAAAEGGATDHLVAEAAPEPEPEGGE